MGEVKNIVSFWLDCIQKAFFDTLAVFDVRKWRVLRHLIPAVVVLLVLWWTSSASEQPEFLYHLKTYVVFLTVTLAWAVVVFVWQLLAAPYRLKMERFITPAFQLLVGQIGPYVQPIENGTLYRLGIRNLSPVNAIEDVVAEVTNIQPDPPHFLPVALHVMHDNPVEGGQYTASFTLGPDPRHSC